MDCVVFLKYLFPIRLSRIAQRICMKFEVKIKAMLYPTVLIVSMGKLSRFPKEPEIFHSHKRASKQTS